MMFKALIETIIKSIVDYPDKVRITQKAGQKVVLIKIIVDKSDVGYIIGREGHIIDAIRTIVQAVGSKERKRVILDLPE
jgi:predicted RNA-binding protein YlqC (UPF0109 family)